MKDEIIRQLNDSIETKKKVIALADDIEKMSMKIVQCLKNGGKLFIFGNGGSAADSQHIATELIHQFEIKDRKAIPCIALTTNTSTHSAIGNDWGYEKIFERQVEALVGDKDVVIGISTSGNSKNVMLAIEEAKRKGAFTIGWLGKDGGKLKSMVDIAIVVPSDKTARIQESHITIGHIMCYLIEKEMAR